jgi:hypothetical protein
MFALHVMSCRDVRADDMHYACLTRTRIPLEPSSHVRMDPPAPVFH